jgi:hypothetical protein
MAHVGLQPSPDAWLPSSHDSPASSAPLPQLVEMHSPAINAKPVAQSNEHPPERHTATAFVGTAQTVHVEPHAVTSVSATHVPLHGCIPVPQPL